MRKFLFALLALCVALPLFAEYSYTVVLDPGHGGKDPGAVGRFSKEKDLNLKLALEVGKKLKEQYPDVKVVYTRSTDVFIPLQERADIANKNNADLFISLHANSSNSKVPRGVETFILGTEKMDKNLDVAMRENAVIKLEADYKTTYQGFDPNSVDSYIMFELMQNSYMDQSLRFAEQVQQRFTGHLNREDRGVRQAAFWVLLKTACPSILFEMGFISNPEEEKFLNQPASMAQMASALVNAFGAYTHRQAVKKEAVQKEPKESKESKEPEDSVYPADKNENDTETTRKRHENDTKTGADQIKTQPALLYAVQICASKTKLDPKDERLKGYKCDYIEVNGWYKYYTAADTDREKVMAARKRLLGQFPDCWIIKIEK